MVAVVTTEKCSGSGACVEVCPAEAIQLKDNIAVVDDDLCIDCEACVDACPSEAIEMD